MTHDDRTVPAGTSAPDWSGMIPEECLHCDQPYPAADIDEHVTETHADLPPCTASFFDGGHSLYTCALRAGHKSAYAAFGHWHVSARGPIGRTVWNDTADGATPHKEPAP